MPHNQFELQGFRSFGQGMNSSTLDMPSLIAAIWGPNSQGKTSLAEAFGVPADRGDRPARPFGKQPR